MKSKGIQTLIQRCITLNNGNDKILANKTEIKVHKKCQTDCLRLKSSIPDPEESTSSCSRSSSSRSRSVADFSLKSCCIICSSGPKKERLIICSDLLKPKLLEIADRRTDILGDTVRQRIINIDSLKQAEAGYHKSCYDEFKYVPKTNFDLRYPELHAAFERLYEFIENSSECQFTLTELKQVLKYNADNKTIIKYLREKYNDDIFIEQSRGKDTIICYSGSGDYMIDDIWYTQQEEEKENENIRIIKTAAELVRKQIKITKYDITSYPSSTIFLDTVQDDVPKYLQIFLNEIMLYGFRRKTKR